jgi:hypothetical protein
MRHFTKFQFTPVVLVTFFDIGVWSQWCYGMRIDVGMTLGVLYLSVFADFTAAVADLHSP